ncbi:MAG: hypothetical protein ACKUBY_05490 [Candidatus Moraniibacteriota bacterium]|jgi:hypothetical protein
MIIDEEYSSKCKKRVKQTSNFVGDSVSTVRQESKENRLSELDEIINNNIQNNTQTLLLENSRTEFFVTEDSRKYVSNHQQYKKDSKYDYIDPRGYFDSIHVRYVKKYTASELQQKRIVAEFRNAQDIATSFRNALKLDLSPIRMWKVSLAGAVLFGMVSMSMIYQNLGQNAMAKEAVDVEQLSDKESFLVIENTIKLDAKEDVEENEEKEVVLEVENADEKGAGVKKEEVKEDIKEKIVENVQEKKTIKLDSIQKKEIEEEQEKKVVSKSVDGITQKEEIDKDNEDVEEEYSLKEAAYEMVEGYPIEKMLPHILKQDPEVAKYLIAMAKQESAWGKRVPVLNGQDCYNYWGFRSKRKLMGSGGHTCFNSREDAVETVGRRIHELIYEYDRKTADRLIVWKCGSSCAGHSQEGVDRWIGTVGNYYDALSEKK